MINISNTIKKYLEWAGFNLKNNNIEYRKLLISEAACYAIYTLVSIVLICKNEPETVVMWLNVICLVQVIIHNVIYASETSKKMELLNIKHKIFNYYRLKIAAVIAASTVVAIITAVSAIHSVPLGPYEKLITVLAILLVLFNYFEELAIYGYGASIVEG